MFNKLKQYKDLHSQAKKMQSMMEAETLSIDKYGIKITVNGKMEVMSIELSDISDKASLEKNLKSAFNNAVKESQTMMAKKMRESGEMPNFNF